MRDLALAPLVGELIFEELLLHGETLAGPLFGLAGEGREARLVLMSKLLLQHLAERDLGAAVGAGDHCRVHGRLFSVGRADLPGAQACAGNRDRLGWQRQPETPIARAGNRVQRHDPVRQGAALAELRA